MRGATIKSCMWVPILYVSIHAPVRGATSVQNRKTNEWMFQFTLPCGERHFFDFIRKEVILCFNSRSRAGSDIVGTNPSVTHASFQFTLPCGERRPLFRFPPNMESVSIHAPVRGATRILVRLLLGVLFQFTLPCGERPVLRCAASLSANVSIHAPVRGATRLRFLRLLTSMFQFTLPCGERRP